MHTATAPKPDVGILLDPPYRTEGRSGGLYGSDLDGTSDDVSVEAYEWAVEHGKRYRIAYCCADGDFPVPDGWDVYRRKAVRTGLNKRDWEDIIMFSPACERRQGKLDL